MLNSAWLSVLLVHRANSAKVSYLMNNPDLRSAAAAGFGGDLADGLCGAAQILTVRRWRLVSCWGFP